MSNSNRNDLPKIHFDKYGRIFEANEAACKMGYETGTFIHPGKESDQAFFVSAVSHELFTPLTALIGLVQMAKDGIYVHDSLEKMERHLQKMSRILDQLILLSKIDSGQYHPQFQSIGLQEIIMEILTDLELRIQEKHLKILFDADGSVYTDRGGLRIILRNILSNAIKYSHIKGLIEINANPKQLICMDEGIGIPGTDQHRIGSQFFRGGNVRRIEGSGLGLSIVKRIASALKIRFSIQSQQNHGTKVIIEFSAFGVDS